MTNEEIQKLIDRCHVHSSKMPDLEQVAAALRELQAARAERDAAISEASYLRDVTAMLKIHLDEMGVASTACGGEGDAEVQLNTFDRMQAMRMRDARLSQQRAEADERLEKIATYNNSLGPSSPRRLPPELLENAPARGGWQMWREYIAAQDVIDNAQFHDNYTDAARARERQARIQSEARALLAAQSQEERR